jgi:hypothetical protein
MTLCALDKEFPIDVEVADSPMFADLITHWRGDSETVAKLQGHLYQEVIEYTRVEQHVVTIRTNPNRVEVGTKVHEQLEHYVHHGPDEHSPIEHAYNPGGLVRGLQPVAHFNVAETGPIAAIKIDEPATEIILLDDNLARFEHIETLWELEAIRLRKKRFRRTRIFLKLVWDAYKTARSS